MAALDFDASFCFKSSREQTWPTKSPLQDGKVLAAGISVLVGTSETYGASIRGTASATSSMIS